MSLFKSLGDLVGDVVTVATAPVKIAVDVTSAIVKPVADAAKYVTDEVSNVLKK